MTVHTEIVPAYAILRLSGQINTLAEEQIEGEFQKMLDMKCPLVLLDFTAVEHINSAGITILIGLAARVNDQGSRLGAFGLSEHYQKIFHMVGLDEYIHVGQDVETVLTDLKSKQ